MPVLLLDMAPGRRSPWLLLLVGVAGPQNTPRERGAPLYRLRTVSIFWGRPVQGREGQGVPARKGKCRTDLLRKSMSFKNKSRKDSKEEKNSGNKVKRQNLVGTGGSATVSTAGRAAPYEMYVGRTHPDTTEEDILGLVQEYTKSADQYEEVSMIDVDLLKEIVRQDTLYCIVLVHIYINKGSLL